MISNNKVSINHSKMHPRGNPDKEKCFEILQRINDKIPKQRYARKVQHYLRSKGVKDIPDLYKIQNVRNFRIYDLEIVKALEAISRDPEKFEPKKKPQTHQQTSMFAEGVK